MQKGLHAPVTAAIKREKLRSPIITKLSGKLPLWQAGGPAGRQCVGSDFNFVCYCCFSVDIAKVWKDLFVQ
jgi:hypothetical protein